jgi:hypothetical protein
LRAPSLVSSDWRCAEHGVVYPLHIMPTVTPEVLAHVRERARVPIWMPGPLLPGWTVTGIGYAGDERSGGRATALACSGPAPLGGVADLLLVAEELGVGLGAGLAGLPSADPGPDVSAPPAAKIEAAGHPTALWTVPGPDDRSVFVGEAKGIWLWAILWPAAAGYLLAEHVIVHDLREHAPVDFVVGATSPYLLGHIRRGRHD